VSQYIGIDLHKAKSFVTRVNGRGRVLEQVELAHASGALQDYLTQGANKGSGLDFDK
jgi:hypothetical protein